MEAVYKSGGKISASNQGLVLDKPAAVVLKVAPEQIAKSVRVGDDLVLTLVDGQQISVPGFFAAYPNEGRNDLVLEDAQGVHWWGQYGKTWTGFEFTEIESTEPVAAWLPWLFGLGLGGLAASSGGGGGKNANQPPKAIDPNTEPGNPKYPGQELDPNGGGYIVKAKEDEPFKGKVTGKDPDGDKLTYELGKPPAHGTVTIDKSTGEYTYTPNKDYEGPDEFTVIVDDGKGGKTTAKVTVNVSPEQDAFDDSVATGFDKPVTIDALGNDKFSGENAKITQVDGKAITEGGAAVALADGSGSVKLVGGKLEFTPNAGFVGDAKFTYTAQTDGGTPEQANVTVTVAANQLPEPTDPNEGLDPSDPDYIPGQTFTPGGGYTVTVGEDTPFNGKITGTDKDNDPLTYELGTPPAHGTVTVTPDGKYTYTPNKDWSGPGTDEFTVIVDDGKGGKTTTTVTVNVSPEQDVTDDTATTGFDKSVTIDVLGNDAFEGDNVKITEVNGTAIAEGQTVVVADGSVKLVGGKLEFTPNAGFVGDAKFTYTAQTDGGTPEQANVTVTVAANQLPEPTDPNEGLDPSDPDYIPGQTFTPGGGYTVTVGEDTPFNGKITGTDKDNDPLTYELGTPPAHGTVTVTPDGKYTYTPNKDWSGPGTDEFTVIVDDGKGGKTTTTVTVNVSPEQDVTDDTATTGFDKSVTIDVLGNDAFEGDNVKITEVNGTAIAEGQTVVVADGSVKLVGGKLEFTPNAGFVGDAKFTYTAQTDGGTPEQANVTVTVAANQLPEPTDPNEGLDPSDPDYIPGQTFTPGGGYTVTVGEDTPFNGKITGTDKDNDPLTYELGTPPAHGTVTVTPDGKYTYTPNKDWSGPGTDEFTVIVDDGKGGKTTTTVTVNVSPEQDVTDDTATTGFDKSVTIDVLGNDAFEGDNVKITEVNGTAIAEGQTVVVADGSVKLVGGKLEFTPNAGFVGDAKFTYTAQTDGGTPEQAKVTVTVAANQLPEPIDPNIDPNNPEFPGQEFTPGPNGGYKITVDEDQPFSGQVKGTDKDGDTLTYTTGTDPKHGTVTVDKDTGKYTYTPDPDYNGPDEFTVIVDDGKGGQTTTTVTVEFKPEVDVVDDTATTGYEKSVTIDVLGNDDFEGAHPTITQVNGKAITEGGAAVVVDHGEVKLVNGQLVFTPEAGYHGGAEFSYTAKTDKGSEETAKVTVTVAANQLPEPIDPNIDPNNPEFPGQEFTPGPNGGYKITVDEDQPFSGQVKGTDKDGDTLTYTTGTDPKHGTVTVDKDTGKYTYTPDPDYNGPDEFTVIVDDGKGGQTTTTVTVEFKPEVDVVDDTATTGYEKSVTIDVLGNDDFEGAHPTITQVNGKAITEGGAAVVVDHGEVKLVNGQLVFTPEAGYHGGAEFSYTAKTDKGSEETAKVTVTVNSLPEFDDTGLPPGTTLTADGYVIGYDEGRTSTDVLGKVHAVDPDSSDAVKYSIDPASNPNGWFQIDENTGEIRLTEEGVKSLANDFEDEDGRNSHQITVVATDSAGGKTSIQVALNEQDVNDTAPVLEIAPGDKVLHVAEEALSGGIKDDPNSTTTATGKISFTDADKTPDINTFSVEMKGPVDGSITSGGVAVTWSWDASSSTLTGMAGAKEVMTIKVDPVALVNGKYEAGYTVTLKGPVDHPKVQGENSLDLDFKAIVHDGVNDSNEIGFTVEVKDDVPALSDNAELAINLAKLQTNLMIVLDLSGSMAWDTKGATLTGGAANPLSRLSIAKKALEELINKYGQYGDVAVKLVTFQGSTANAYATWMSAATAIAKINALTATGGTPHATALKTLMESANGFADNVGKLVGGQNVSYFITDGAPSTGQEVYGKPIQGQWESFLATNHINSVVVGFSEGIVAGDKNALDAMAYNGTATPPVDTDGFFAKTATELTDTLQNNIQLPRQEGSLRGELDTTEGFGADDGFVNVLNVDGKTYTYLPGQTLQVTGGAVAGVDYTYDAVKHVITVKTAAGGSLTVEFDTAKFIYVGKALSSYWDKFGYTIQDMDGDTASTVKDVKVVYDGVDPGPKPAPFASPMMAMSLDLEHLDALHADVDDPAALPALHDVLQPQTAAGEAGGNIAGLGSADAPAAPAAPVAAPQDLALYMPAPLPEEELHQPVHV